MTYRYRHWKTWLFVSFCGFFLALYTLQQEPKNGAESYLCSDREELSFLLDWLKAEETHRPFIKKIVKKLGKPLWDVADIENTAEETFVFVPLHHSRYGKSIRAIWFFYKNKEGDIYQCIKERVDENMDFYDQVWLCSYFGYKIFGTENTEHIMFLPATPSKERAEIETCWDAYMGATATTAIEDYKYQGRYCKYKMIWVKWATESGIKKWIEEVPPARKMRARVPKSLRKLIHRNLNLNIDAMEKLRDAVKILRADSYSRIFLKHLEEKSYAVGCVRIFDEKQGNASYNDTNGYLSFQTEEFITHKILFHELFHLYQHKTNQIDRKKDIGWMEYERIIATDILVYIAVAGEKDRKFWEKKHDSLVTDYIPQDRKDAYLDWIDRVTHSGTTYPTRLTDEELLQFFDLYKATHPTYYKRYTYDHQFSFHTIRTIMKVFATSQ